MSDLATRAASPGDASGEPCGVDSCPALAVDDRGLCVIHLTARRLISVMAGSRCTKCLRLLEAGDFVTAASTLVELTHVSCPPARQAAARKTDQQKPLLDAGGFYAGRH